MPLYEFVCSNCGQHFEKMMRFSELDLAPECPHCHSRETHKQISTFASRITGGGVSGLGTLFSGVYVGLDAGADDYLVKPFDLAELSARIGSVARRYGGNPNPLITHGPLQIDLTARSIHRDGHPVQLTAREWALLEAFLSRPGQLLSKAQLEDKLYAFDAEVESNTIEVHVSRLRKKLGADLIVTERGLGYRLGPA